jgi:hypothetical protein
MAMQENVFRYRGTAYFVYGSSAGLLESQHPTILTLGSFLSAA